MAFLVKYRYLSIPEGKRVPRWQWDSVVVDAGTADEAAAMASAAGRVNHPTATSIIGHGVKHVSAPVAVALELPVRKAGWPKGKPRKAA